MALVRRGGAVYLTAQQTATSTSNPWDFTPGQIAAGFESANIVGQKYPNFHEAPTQYLASTTAEAESDAGGYGMLGSLFGPQIRQALETPIQHRNVPLSGSVSGPGGEISYNVSIDWALGEKQATMGTPQYFRKLYRDSVPWDDAANMAALSPGSYLGDVSPSANAMYQSYKEQAQYASSLFGSSMSTTGTLKAFTPSSAAASAINTGYSSTVKTAAGTTPFGDVDPRVRALESLRPTEHYLGTGTGDFETSHVRITGSFSYPAPSTRLRF